MKNFQRTGPAYNAGLLLAIKTAGLSDPFPALLPGRKLSDVELMAAIRQALVSEHDAVAQYELQAEAADNPEIQKVLRSIADEERVHTGELSHLLELLDSKEKDLYEKGQREAAEL